MTNDDEDPFGAFGSDDDNDDDDVDSEEGEVVHFLVQHFVLQNAQVPLKHRIVAATAPSASLSSALQERGIENLRIIEEIGGKDVFDAVIWMRDITVNEELELYRALGPGACLIYKKQELSLDTLRWEQQDSEMQSSLLVVRRRPRVQCSKQCPWLPNNYPIHKEVERVTSVTVPLAVSEQHDSSSSTAQQRLTPSSIQRAVATLQTYGVCILPRLLPASDCLEWGRAALDDLHHAARLLLEREQVDLHNPVDSVCDPATYRELSMREDLRLDLRDGPAMRQLHSDQGNRIWTVPASTTSGPFFFRGAADLLEIVRQTMNPRDEVLAPGNELGRCNFGGGSSKSHTYQDLRVGPIGGLISLPGAADQALHADIPHLFEHLDCLPAHYINAFTPGYIPNDDSAGQTAFLLQTHRLTVASKYETLEASKVQLWKQHLIRPQLEPGDVVLFDCRVWHFGLANMSKQVERPILYTNMTMHWFTDPKNWDTEKPIFTPDDYKRHDVAL
jgi:hypothetical protein